jgi:hypothetical protein
MQSGFYFFEIPKIERGIRRPKRDGAFSYQKYGTVRRFDSTNEQFLSEILIQAGFSILYSTDQ